jgi:uncharacterized protein
MRMPDVNILVYAHRVEEPEHLFYRSWLENLANGAQPFALSALVAVAFVRVVTHPRFSSVPTSLDQALAVIGALRRSPQCRWLLPGIKHWDLTESLCRATQAHGKIVADVQHAAVALEYGCRWVTRDLDFQAFVSHGLDCEWLEPAR